MSKSILAVVIAPVVAAVVFSPTAQADRADDYAARNATKVCAVLDQYPTFDGIIGIGSAIVEKGFTWYEAGTVVGWSIINVCPEYRPLLAAFVARYNSHGTLA